ncbi:HAD family hydrolase [Sulfitobacter sp. TBRI5]|uniref:HAD family hydrolase n=1 Tax=Sulfitobacter sp. TBRI5 TaxID=2989732 RepID=UPI003D9AFFD0
MRNHLKSCSPHHDVLGLLNTARSSGIKIAVFTNAPSNYVKTLLTYFDISVDMVIAYHDIQEHKPSAQGVYKILDHFAVSNQEALYLGDNELDRGSAINAGVEFFAVEWGTVDGIDSAHLGVSRLSEYIGSRLGNESAPDARSELLVDGNKLFLGYYLEGIKQEVWSFKDGVPSAVTRWMDKSVELANLFPDIDIVVRALGHDELIAETSEKPLDTLGNTLAKALNDTALTGTGALFSSNVMQFGVLFGWGRENGGADRTRGWHRID